MERRSFLLNRSSDLFFSRCLTSLAFSRPRPRPFKKTQKTATTAVKRNPNFGKLQAGYLFPEVSLSVLVFGFFPWNSRERERAPSLSTTKKTLTLQPAPPPLSLAPTLPRDRSPAAAAPTPSLVPTPRLSRWESATPRSRSPLSSPARCATPPPGWGPSRGTPGTAPSRGGPSCARPCATGFMLRAA